MSSQSRRGGFRRGSHHHRYQTNEHWTIKPVSDNGAVETQGTSSSASTPEASFKSLHADGGRTRAQNRGNSRSETRNRGGRFRFVRNYRKERELSDGDGATSATSILDSSSRSGEASGGASGLELDRVSNVDKIRADRADIGKGEAIAGMSNSSNVDDEDEAVRRLEELRLSTEEEHVLSEEMMSTNKQLQEDELLAMESIYEDNMFMLDNQSGLKCFQIRIHVEAPKGLNITAKFNSSLQERRDDGSSDFSYSFQVEYLPPIVLTCLLPELYPSKCPPLFTIYAQWLGSSKISELCSKLDSIWLEQEGQEVIYPWVEWLHSCTLSYLGFDDEIVLGPYGVGHKADRRVISGSVSPEIDIPSIRNYNDEQRLENFSKNIQECCICFSEYAGSEFIRLPCQHFFCEKCMKTFSDMHVKEGTVMKLKCPEAKCEGMIPPGLLKRLVGEEEFEHWESLMLQKTLDSMKDVAYCPRCQTACLEDEDNHAQCSKCFYSFCTLCRERRHVGISCLTPDMKLVILQDRQNSTLVKEEQRRREEDMINQLLSMKEISHSAKQCPSCKMAITQTEGCNKMVCGNCGQYFCYRCNKAISGYDHFREGNCVLFPTEEVQRWEQRMNNQQIVGQIQAEIFPHRGQPCPNCGQLNVKMGNNNHIFCWSCQNHYCHLCKKMVKRSSQHFGSKGCKQHTAD